MAYALRHVFGVRRRRVINRFPRFWNTFRTANTIWCVQGMNVTIVTSTDSDDEAREMLKLFGLPFRDADATNAA